MPLGTKLQEPVVAAGTREASTWLDLQALQRLRAGGEGREQENVRAVAQQFEQVFLGMMLKSMRDAKLADGAMEGEGTRLYQDLYDKQVTLTMAQGRGLGIAEMLVRQLAPAAAPATATSAADASPADAAGARRPLPSNPKLGAVAFARAYEAVGGGTRHHERTGAGIPTARGVAAADVAPPLAPDLAGLPPELTGGAPRDALRSPATAAPAEPMPARGASQRFADSPEEFVRKVLPHARAAAAELGVSPAAIVAQAALETGWGRHVPAAADGTGHNLFGIKAGRSWTGATLGRATVEVEGGVAVQTQASFRAYRSVADGFRDYVDLLRSSGRYAAARGAGDDPARFAHALQAGGYATDPHYARKLLQIVHGSTLREAMAAAGADAGPVRLALKTDAGPPIT